MNLAELRKLREQAQRGISLRGGHKEFRITVSMGTSGIAAGAREVMRVLLEEIERRELDNVEVRTAGSLGLDDVEPVLTVEKEGEEAVTYGNLDAAAARAVIADHVVRGRKLDAHTIGKAKNVPR
jgi:NADP-reducing hydrogenase subunit HndB